MKSYRTKVNELKGEFEHVATLCFEEGLAKQEAAAHVNNVEQAQVILQQIVQTVQEHAHQQLADVVSRCLAAVFEEPYEFHILFEKKRGKTEARLVFKRGEYEVDPMSASGGGVVDVASFAMRLASLVLTMPPARRMLVLDEPFRFVSADNLPHLRVLLETLAAEMQVQFVIVTHITTLRIGKVVQLTKGEEP